MGESRRRALLIVIAIVFMMMPLKALSQPGGPGSPPPAPQYFISANSVVKALVYDVNADPPSGSSAILNHQAVFQFQLDWSNGATAPSEYDWHISRAEIGAQDPENPIELSVMANSIIVDGEGHSRNATGRAFAPGEYVISCEARIVLPGGQQTQSVNIPPLTVYVIGGPITYSRIESYYATESGSFVVGGVPFSDDVDTLHAQYFDGEILSGVQYLYEQIPQGFIASIYNQPTGTQVVWDTGTLIVDPFASTGLSKSVYANAGSGTEVITCAFSLQKPNGSASCTDTTQSTGSHYEISFHQPAHIEQIKAIAGHPNYNPPVEVPSRHSAKLHVTLKVTDHNGVAMPGVLLQEKFTQLMPSPYVPPNWKINTVNNFWTTSPSLDSCLFQFYSDVLFSDHNQSYSYGVTAGEISQFDNLSLVWASGDSQTMSAIHEYWAGTRRVDGLGGVNIGPWTIQFIAGPQLGQSGTVNHSD